MRKKYCAQPVVSLQRASGISTWYMRKHPFETVIAASTAAATYAAPVGLTFLFGFIAYKLYRNKMESLRMLSLTAGAAALSVPFGIFHFEPGYEREFVRGTDELISQIRTTRTDQIYVGTFKPFSLLSWKPSPQEFKIAGVIEKKDGHYFLININGVKSYKCYLPPQTPQGFEAIGANPKCVPA